MGLDKNVKGKSNYKIAVSTESKKVTGPWQNITLLQR